MVWLSGDGAGWLSVPGRPTTYIVGQGPAVLAAGAGRVRLFSTHLTYLPF